MKKNIFQSFLLLLTLPYFALAETTTTGSAPNPGPAPAPQGRGIQIFDDRVFDLKPSETKPTTRKSSVTGSERFLADEPDYNSEQREQWIESCQPQRDKNLQAFRDCFNGQKRKAKQDLRNKFDKVESEQDIPLEKRLPSSDKSPSSAPAFREVDLDSLKQK